MIFCPNEECPTPMKEFRDVGALWNHCRGRRINGHPECYIALQNVKFVIKMPERKSGIRAAIRREFSNPWLAFQIGWAIGLITWGVVMPWFGPHLCAGWTPINGCGWWFHW